MRLQNPDLLANYMQRKRVTGAQLAREAKVSRQFINRLLKSEATRGCTPEVATAIEVALDLIPGTLFSEGPKPTRNKAKQTVAA